MLEEGIFQFALLGAEWVLWVLVALSIGVVALAIERALFLARSGTPREPLAEAVGAYLRTGDAAACRSRIAALDGFEARVLGAGLDMSDKGPIAMQRAMEGTATGEKMRMDRGLSYLATVGANAPFIGLFGTVLGIIQAFHDLAQDSGNPSEAVMAGISEALVATAVGLAVAIPAVILYNGFNRWVKSRVTRTESVADLLLARRTADTSPATETPPREAQAHGR